MSKKKKTRRDFTPENASNCHIAGCTAPGAYKAPKSKDMLHEYAWYCLDHIREYNQKWDYFSGMERQEIESFIKDAVTGHRPTWSREVRMRHGAHTLYDALYEFLHPGQKAPKPPSSLPPNAQLRKALAIMDIDYPYTQPMLKKRYRILVKQYHPDVNKGNRQAEDRFKRIAEAHRLLLEHLHLKKT